MNIVLYENMADFSFREEEHDDEEGEEQQGGDDDHHPRSSCHSDDEEEEEEEEEDLQQDDPQLAEEGSSSQDDSVVLNRLWHRPIVVGYSFGPKKMSTMGVVMAEASKTRLNTNMFQSVWEGQLHNQQRDKDRDHESVRSNSPHPDAGVSKLEEREVGGPSEHEKETNEKHCMDSKEDVAKDDTPKTATRPASSNNVMLTKEALTSFGKEPPPSPRPFAVSSGTTARIRYSAHIDNNKNSDHSRGKANQDSASAPPTSLLFSLDHSYLGGTMNNNMFHRGTTSNIQTTTAIVRQLDDSLPSTSFSWGGSTGTRTASTAASFRTLSAGGTGSITGSTTLDSSARSSSQKRQHGGSSSQQRNHRNSSNNMIRVAFVPLDPEIPLSEQHGGMDVILHKLTEDILLLSQLTSQYPPLEGILKLPRESAMERVLDQCHSLTDEADRAAIRRVFRLCQFQKQHGCFLVDDPVAVLTLMSRADIARVLQKCLQSVTSLSGIPVRSPNYAVVVVPTPTTQITTTTTLEEGGTVPATSDDEAAAKKKNEAAQKAVRDANLSFPLIVKPLTAAGTKASHAMAVVTHPSGLPRATDRIPSCLLQEYANHNAVLYKVYVLGDFVSVHKRRSLPNLPRNTAASPPVVEFDSQRPYPRLRDFGYPPSIPPTTTTGQSQDPVQSPSLLFSDDAPTELESEAGGWCYADKPVTALAKKPMLNHGSTADFVVTAEEVKPIAEALKQAFGLQIFGFDILITTTEAESSSNDNNNKNEPEQQSQQQPTMLVVDVNYFPSYKEVPNFPALLAKYLTGRAIASRLEKAKVNCNR